MGVLITDLAERRGSSLRDGDPGIVPEENVALGAAEREAQRCGFSSPAHPGGCDGGFDVAPPPSPVDVVDFPRACREDNDPRAVDLPRENDGVDGAEFLTPLENCELGVGREYGDQVHEVAATESLLGIRPDEEHSVLGLEV